MSYPLYFRTPSGVINEVQVEPTTTMGEVAEKICDCDRLLPRGRIALYFNHTKLQPQNTVREYNLKPAAVDVHTKELKQAKPVVTVIILLGNPGLLSGEDCTYDSFVDVCFPNNGDKDIPLNIQPLIKFKKSQSEHMVHLPSLADIAALQTQGDGNMREYLGEEISTSLGFTKWTETGYPNRLFLLEIDRESILPELKAIKYSSFTNNVGYTNGDRHSWQRYSRVYPIDCYVHVNEGDNSARLLPTEPLKPSTVYAIVLLNGVPVIPANYQSMSNPLFSYWRPGICEDMIVAFRTKKPRVFKVPTATAQTADVAPKVVKENPVTAELPPAIVPSTAQISDATPQEVEENSGRVKMTDELSSTDTGV